MSFKLPESLTTVTPLSKLIALIIFIFFPFLGFYLGIHYQKSLTIASSSQQLTSQIICPSPAPTQGPTIIPVDTSNWKTIIFTKYHFSLQIPPDWSITNDALNGTLIRLSGRETKVDDWRNLITVYDGKTASFSLVLDQGFPGGLTVYTTSPALNAILSTIKVLPTPSTQLTPVQPNEFDLLTAKVGDKVVGMTIKSIHPLVGKNLSTNDYAVEFTGPATLSGAYNSISGEVLFSGIVCLFDLEQDSLLKLPRVKGSDKNVTVCFSKQPETALNFLGPVGKSGRASVTIDNYQLLYGPTLVFDKADFVKLISKTN